VWFRLAPAILAQGMSTIGVDAGLTGALSGH